jgi:glycosyltransferase involved in cell wall biosynthesis
VLKPRIVILVEYYLPGFRAGGPVRSVSALVQQLHDAIDFFVITRDRDVGSNVPYPDIHRGEWTTTAGARVRYLMPHEITATALVAAVRQGQPDAIYLNSLFAPMSVRLLFARRLGALKDIPILLAPRGELSPGALRLKAFKKHSFLRLSHWLGLHRDVVFHASTKRERGEIVQAIGARDTPRIARNPVGDVSTNTTSHAKQSGSARFVFLSRIAKKKNLHLAIERLATVNGSIELAIYGPVEPADQMYWHECRSQIADMPSNVAVTYHGPVEHERVGLTLAAHDFFLFPTASENFGHVIVEALSAGCPIITSDQTPWLDLAKRGVGWDLPLDDVDAWRRVLQQCVDMNAEAHAVASLQAQSFANQIVSTDTLTENLRLFTSVLEARRMGQEPILHLNR